MGEGLITVHHDSKKQLSQKIGGEVVVTDSGSNSAENKSKSAKSRSSSRMKVNHDKRAMLVHNHMASSNSYILQEELASNSFKRSNSSKNMAKSNPKDLLVPEEQQVEKMYLSKDDHEVVESSSSNESSRQHNEFGLTTQETQNEDKLGKLARYTSIIDFLQLYSGAPPVQHQ